MENAVAIFKCLGDETRYNILCQLYYTDSYVELLASNLNLTPGTVSFHLKKMEKVGLVKCSRNQFYMIYSLNREIIGATIESFIEAKETKDEESEYRKKVIASFFKLGKLVQIPVQQKKREIVLSEIIKDFKNGVEYTEKEVNDTILRYNDDYCTIRRWFIEDGFMKRKNDKYYVIKY